MKNRDKEKTNCTYLSGKSKLLIVWAKNVSSRQRQRKDSQKYSKSFGGKTIFEIYGLLNRKKIALLKGPWYLHIIAFACLLKRKKALCF